MKLNVAILCLATLTACSSGPETKGPEKAPGKTAAVTTPPVVTKLYEHVGEVVTVRGRTSKLVQAHMIEVVPGKRVDYVDVPDFGQIVVYTREQLPEETEVELVGKVLRVGGGPEGSKAREFVEYQLDVESWKLAKK